MTKHIQLVSTQANVFGTVDLALLLRQGFTVDIFSQDLPAEELFNPLQETSNRSFSSLEYLEEVVENIPNIVFNPFFNGEKYVPIRGVRVRIGTDLDFTLTKPVIESVDCL
jgi:hypothetical protein